MKGRGDEYWARMRCGRRELGERRRVSDDGLGVGRREEWNDGSIEQNCKTTADGMPNGETMSEEEKQLG